MAVSRRGSQIASSFGTANAASIAVSLPGAATAGDLLVVGVNNSGTEVPDAADVTDNQAGNTYGLDAVGSAAASASRSGQYSVLSINASGTFTVTYTPDSSANSLFIVLSEYNPGGATISRGPTAAGGSNSANTSYTTSTTTDPGVTDGVAVATVGNLTSANQAILTSSPYTEIASDGNGLTDNTGAMSDRIITATGTQQCTWTSQSVVWDACIAVYTAAASAAVASSAGIRTVQQAMNRLASFFRGLIPARTT